MNKVTCEQKISCMLFGCPMIEEIPSCSISNLRVLTSKLKFWVDERVEVNEIKQLISPKYLCMIEKQM